MLKGSFPVCFQPLNGRRGHKMVAATNSRSSLPLLLNDLVSTGAARAEMTWLSWPELKGWLFFHSRPNDSENLEYLRKKFSLCCVGQHVRNWKPGAWAQELRKCEAGAQRCSHWGRPLGDLPECFKDLGPSSPPTPEYLVLSWSTVSCPILYKLAGTSPISRAPHPSVVAVSPMGHLSVSCRTGTPRGEGQQQWTISVFSDQHETSKNRH